MRNKASRFAICQTAPSDRWPDGTPRSVGNAFTAYLDGQPSVLNTPTERQYSAARGLATQHVEAMRAQGIEPGWVGNLSGPADEARRNKSHNNPRYRLPVWLGPNKPPARRRATPSKPKKGPAA